MKKAFSFLLFVSLATIAANAGGPFDNEESSTQTLGIKPKCGRCGLRHLPACTTTTPPPLSAPIDGGLSLLLAAGAAYGVRRMRTKKPE